MGIWATSLLGCGLLQLSLRLLLLAPVPLPGPLPGSSYHWDVPTDPGEMAKVGVWTFPNPSWSLSPALTS